MDSLTIRKPDDWHVHLRDGALLKAALPFTTMRFKRAIVMPNIALKPVVTTNDIVAYKAEIMSATSSAFEPLMTYYLTDNSSPADISNGFREGIATAVKLYPAYATTNSEMGVTDVRKVYPVLEEMQKTGMCLLIHGEVVTNNGHEIDPKDREKIFLDTTLPTLRKDFPELRIVLEHASTKNAVQFIQNENPSRLASTITAHHLMISSDDIALSDRPAHLSCAPIIKTPEDRTALRKAATSGDKQFFLGTDSAPHSIGMKESETPPVGVFTAPAALEFYAQVFEEEGKMQNFEAFASLNGPAFYNLEPNTELITLVKNPWTIDSLVDIGNGEFVRPFGYDENPVKRLRLQWKLQP